MTANLFQVAQYSLCVHTGFDDDGAYMYECQYLVAGEPQKMVPWLAGLALIEALRADFYAQHQAQDAMIPGEDD